MSRRSAGLRVLFVASTVVIALSPATRLHGQRLRFFSDDNDTRAGAAAARAAGVPRRRVARADLARLTAVDRATGLAVGSATSLDLNLFDGVEYVAQLDRLEDLGGGRFSWIGDLIGVPEGRAILAVADGVLAGSITTSTDAYAIRWQPGDLYEIEQVDRGGFKPEAQPLRVDAADLIDRSAPNDATPRADDGSIIDVLVAYTPAARAGAGSTAAMTSLITLGVSETNQAYATNGLPARLRLVGTYEWNTTETTSSAGSQLTTFRASSEIAALRNSLGADLVTLIVQTLDNACGIAYIMTTLTTGFAGSGYNVVQRSCVSPNYSFAHELGHNMGSDHAPEDNATSGVYSYSSGYKDQTGGFRTIMAYDCTVSCRRQLFFSAPGGVFGGRPTGRTSQDNGRSLANTMSTVANFRSSAPQAAPPGAPTNLTASASGSSVTLQWTAPAGGTAPTTYTIEAGTGSGRTDLASFPTGSTVTSYSTAGVPSGVYYLRVRASNAAGASGASNESVLTVGGACSAAPGAPSGLRVTSNAGGTVMLAWNASPGTPTTYIVEAGSGPGLANLASTNLGGTATTLTASAVGRGTYFVRIRGRNACGTGAASNEITLVVS